MLFKVYLPYSTTIKCLSMHVSDQILQVQTSLLRKLGSLFCSQDNIRNEKLRAITFPPFSISR